MKVCARSECSNINPQPISNFPKNKSQKDGIHIHCRQCCKFFTQKSYIKHKSNYNAKTLVYRGKDREKWVKRSRDNMLKREYGLTPEQWDQMHKEQNECCKICGVHSNTIKKPLAVDHCHITGKIRGLLCYHCNWLIGHAKDNIEILKKTIEYLSK